MTATADPTTAPVLTLKLTPDAVAALAVAATWFRGELWRYLEGKPCAPSLTLLVEDLRAALGDAATGALLQRHHDKLAALEPKLTRAFDRLHGIPEDAPHA